MIERVDNLPVVLTCFAYRSEYFSELDGMLATAREHHPDWRVVVGRGPMPGFDLPTLEVESPAGKCHWSLPVALNLEGGEDDWRRITRMKGWWISQVWHNFGGIADSHRNRIVWIDADARLGGPLDIELEPEAEVLAAPWWLDPEYLDNEGKPIEGVSSGLLLFQGARQGKVETLIDLWSSKCVSEIKDLPPRMLDWHDGDQELLAEILKTHSNSDAVLLKLENNKYAGYVTKYGVSRPGTLVLHWLMSARMWKPENSDEVWPPPEDYRRRVAVESGFPEKSANGRQPNSPGVK